MAKDIKSSIFYLYVIKDPIQKLEAKHTKFCLHKFWGDIVVHIQAKYQKERMKSEGVYLI